MASSHKGIWPKSKGHKKNIFVVASKQETDHTVEKTSKNWFKITYESSRSGDSQWVMFFFNFTKDFKKMLTRNGQLFWRIFQVKYLGNDSSNQ